MTTIVPAWIASENDRGVYAILGSEPPKDAQPQFIPKERLESVVKSEHEVDGMRFAVLVIKEARA